MTIVKALATGAVALGFALTGGVAQGATAQNVGTFDASSVTTTNKHGSFDHTVWLTGFDGSAVADRYWQFVDGEGVFDVTESGATLDATIVQNTNASNMMELSMEFTVINGPGSGGNKCGGDCSDTSGWDYFDFVTATLTGIGDLAGTVLTLEIFPIDDDGLPAMPGQLGMGANDKDAGMGFSTWFSWTDQDGRSGRGDVNLQLAMQPPEIPLPMPALLLLTGLGAMGATRKFRRT